MTRTPVQALVLILFAAILAGVLCGLQAADDQEVKSYQESYRVVPVTVTVTNLTGTDGEELNAPRWAANVFWEEYPTSHGLRTYLKDLRLKVINKNMQSLIVNGVEEGVRILVGISDIQADSQIHGQKGNMVTWFEGYGEEILMEMEPVCIISEELAKAYPVEEWMHMSVEMVFCYDPGYGDADPTTYRRSYRVVGVHKADPTVVYCPYLTATQVFYGLGQPLEVYSISATLRDNGQLEQMQREADYWFARPSITGEKTPWKYSYYTSYPYALDIDDSQLRAAEETMENSLVINRICTRLVLLLSAGAGGLIGFLMVRNRKREIALMQTMGTSFGQIYRSFLLEQLMCVLVGIGLGGAAFGWHPMQRLELLAAVYLVGLSAALILCVKKNLLTTIKESE